MPEPKRSTPKKKFTIRQQKYKANRIAGMSQYNAARAAGYAEATATKAHRIEKGVKGSIQDALEQAGLTAKYQASKALELTKATKVISCNVFIDKDGKMKEADGKTLDFIEVADGHVQLRALEHIAKLKKQLFEDKPITVNVEAHTHLTLIKKFLTKAKDIDVHGRIKSAISG